MLYWVCNGMSRLSGRRVTKFSSTSIKEFIKQAGDMNRAVDSLIITEANGNQCSTGCFTLLTHFQAIKSMQRSYCTQLLSNVTCFLQLNIADELMLKISCFCLITFALRSVVKYTHFSYRDSLNSSAEFLIHILTQMMYAYPTLHVSQSVLLTRFDAYYFLYKVFSNLDH